MATTSISEKKWKNTFAPRCKNKYLTAGQLICGLRYGSWQMKDLPEDAREAVLKRTDELHRK